MIISLLLVCTIVAIISAVAAGNNFGNAIGQNVNDAIQSQNENRSLIASVINITNHTNPIGIAVQQMIQATSTGNETGAMMSPTTDMTSPTMGGNLTNEQPSPSRINWGQLCRNPLVDSLITEPCETLTTPDGHTLTSEGERVFLVCIGGDAFATMLGHPEVAASLGSLAKCGESTSQSDNDNTTNLLKGLMGNYTK